MSDIIVCWYSPDAAVARRVFARVKQSYPGRRVFEYSDKMRAGDELNKRIINEINLAKIAVICFSEASASAKSPSHEWFERELKWCFKALHEGDRPMHTILPVKVGALKEKAIPELLKEPPVFVRDLSQQESFEREQKRLIDDIDHHLKQFRIWIPATVFAATQEKLELTAGKALDAVKKLCEAAGMAWDEAELRSRYGPSASAFQPFGEKARLIDAIQAEVGKLNSGPRQQHFCYLALRWYDPDELLDDDTAIDDWRNNEHLCVVDSLSMLDNNQLQALTKVLSYKSDKRLAFLWVPPYTLHTRNLIGLIGEALDATLRTHFDDWSEKLETDLSFDVATDVALRYWVKNYFQSLNLVQRAQKENTLVMQKEIAAPDFTPADGYPTAPGFAP